MYKGRNYTQRGGTNPIVTFDPKPCRRSAQPTLTLLFFTPRHGAVTATKGRFGLLGDFLYFFPHRATDAVTATALFYSLVFYGLSTALRASRSKAALLSACQRTYCAQVLRHTQVRIRERVHGN
jgi:hypothetical protein